MPANIAHVLIAQDAYEALRDKNESVAETVLSKNQFFYLGSLGPDLPSYKTSELVKEALSQLLIRPFVKESNPREEDASFFLHSTRPNLFPWYLMETNTAFARLEGGRMIQNEFNEAVFAFTMGYVCHIAADQIIHRLVRQMAGPYYRSLETAQKHSDCEVHQDVFLFHHKMPDREFAKTIVPELINVDKLGFEYDSFCNLISLSISKAGYPKTNPEDINGWLNGIQLTFDLMDEIGPYVKAIEEYQKHRDDLGRSAKYREYFRDGEKGVDYMQHYDMAVSLAVNYMAEIADLWISPDFSYERFVRYQIVVQPEDMTSPTRANMLTERHASQFTYGHQH